MTLDEAIEHAKRKSIELGCSTCAEEHLQLAKWLEDYRYLLSKKYEIDDMLSKMRDDGR